MSNAAAAGAGAGAGAGAADGAAEPQPSQAGAAGAQVSQAGAGAQASATSQQSFLWQRRLQRPAQRSRWQRPPQRSRWQPPQLRLQRALQPPQRCPAFAVLFSPPTRAMPTTAKNIAIPNTIARFILKPPKQTGSVKYFTTPSLLHPDPLGDGRRRELRVFGNLRGPPVASLVKTALNVSLYRLSNLGRTA